MTSSHYELKQRSRNPPNWYCKIFKTLPQRYRDVRRWRGVSLLVLGWHHTAVMHTYETNLQTYSCSHF